MEGSDFDFYSSSRPRPEDFSTYELVQPVTNEPAPPPKKGISKGTVLVLVFAGICVLILFGTLMLALIGPLLQKDVDLEVNISKGGTTFGDKLYIDPDNIQISVRNSGKETAYANNITLKISGDNVADRTIPWPGTDIPPGHGKSAVISIEVIDMFSSFTLKVSIYYNEDYHDYDRIP